MTVLSKKVAIFGDIHFPFEDQIALSKAIDIATKLKPDAIIQVGDLYDFFSYSKYPKSPNVLTPKEECAIAKVRADAFWSKLRRSCPKARLVQLTGNHDERIVKKALENSPEYEHIAMDFVSRLMSFNGVEIINSSKEEFIYDGVCYLHGFRKFGEHSTYNQMNTVTGHLHRAGISYNQNINGTFFEMNVGWLGDKRHEAFSYYSQKNITKTTVGLGLIDSYGPRFVSLE